MDEFVMNSVLYPADNMMRDMVRVQRQAAWDRVVRNGVTRIVNHLSSNAPPVGTLLITTLKSNYNNL
jgi:hypothetical protein